MDWKSGLYPDERAQLDLIDVEQSRLSKERLKLRKRGWARELKKQKENADGKAPRE